MTTKTESVQVEKLDPRKWVKFNEKGWIATAKLHPSGRKLLSVKKGT